MLAFCSLWATGCGKFSDAANGFGVRKVEARAAEDGLQAFLTYREALIGKDPGAVVGVFGKPNSIFEKRHGKVWMYSRWCVEFDARDRVVRLERDIAATGIGGDLASPSMALTAGPTAPSQAGATPDGITRISNGGQTVDLTPLMPAGKITVVDFYAEWCGPCRRIGPSLEELAGGDPDVVLVKVDIVKWGSPVTRQYGIQSVPNIRVFDRTGRQIGQPTYSLAEVRSAIEKAGG